MGIVANVSATRYPKQTESLNRRVRVCFDFEPEPNFLGTIIRIDAELPGRTIIKLDDGRVLLSTECMYSYE
jgi:hypothetical protein